MPTIEHSTCSFWKSIKDNHILFWYLESQLMHSEQARVAGLFTDAHETYTKNTRTSKSESDHTNVVLYRHRLQNIHHSSKPRGDSLNHYVPRGFKNFHIQKSNLYILTRHIIYEALKA